MECTHRIYYLDRSQIAYLKFVLEGHEGLAFMSTLDPQIGKIALFVPPGRAEELDIVLKALQPEIRLRPATSESDQV